MSVIIAVTIIIAIKLYYDINIRKFNIVIPR
jgi:hypothetical protein